MTAKHHQITFRYQPAISTGKGTAYETATDIDPLFLCFSLSSNYDSKSKEEQRKAIEIEVRAAFMSLGSYLATQGNSHGESEQHKQFIDSIVNHLATRLQEQTTPQP